MVSRQAEPKGHNSGGSVMDRNDVAGTSDEDAQQMTLLLDEPDWLTKPRTTIERNFRAFHDANPDVYTRLEGLALHAMRQGDRRISVGELTEYLRHEASAFQTAPDEKYKFNNNYRALYARLLIFRHPELGALIETRARRERAKAAGGAR